MVKTRSMKKPSDRSYRVDYFSITTIRLTFSKSSRHFLRYNVTLLGIEIRKNGNFPTSFIRN